MIPKTVAGKMQVLEELLNTNEYDDEGRIIGQKAAYLTKEEALELFKRLFKIEGSQDDKT